MIRNRLAKWVFGSTFVMSMLIPALAFAQEHSEEAASTSSGAWQIEAYKAIAAGLAMGLAALGAGYAQGKIGSAGAGALAERPEISTWIITLQALPEIIVLLGFVAAILILG
jgi:V/A-type H+-transporting ATPase subunit K